MTLLPQNTQTASPPDIAIQGAISVAARGIWQLNSVANESAEVIGLATLLWNGHETSEANLEISGAGIAVSHPKWQERPGSGGPKENLTVDPYELRSFRQ
jgi:hypothetical protein